MPSRTIFFGAGRLNVLLLRGQYGRGALSVLLDDMERRPPGLLCHAPADLADNFSPKICSLPSPEREHVIQPGIGHRVPAAAAPTATIHRNYERLGPLTLEQGALAVAADDLGALVLQAVLDLLDDLLCPLRLPFPPFRGATPLPPPMTGGPALAATSNGCPTGSEGGWTGCAGGWTGVGGWSRRPAWPVQQEPGEQAPGAPGWAAERPRRCRRLRSRAGRRPLADASISWSSCAAPPSVALLDLIRICAWWSWL